MLTPLWWRVAGMMCVISGIALVHPGLSWNAVVVSTCGLIMLIMGGNKRRDIFGFALLLGAGQAATMEVLDTSRFAVYEHFPVWDAILGSHTGFLLAIAAITTALGVAFASDTTGLSTVKAWSRRHPWRTVFICGAVAFSAAVPARSASATITEFALGTWLSLGMAGAGVCLVCALSPHVSGLPLPPLAARISWPGDDGTLRQWDSALPWLLAVATTVIAASYSVFVFDGMPHIDDSVSYLFQAKYFATGRLWLDAPVDSAAFHVDEVVVHGTQWFGYGFPGWPAALAAGVRVGLPWLINPLLGGITIVALHRIVRLWHDRGTANAATLLLVVSPWFVVMSAEFMPHALALALAAGALYCALRVRNGDSILWSAGVGLLLGWLVLTRPLDAVLVTLLCASIMIVAQRLGRIVAAGVLSASCASVLGLLIVPYNTALTGRGDYTPQMMWTDRRWGPGLDRYGFGADIGIREWSQIDPLPGHGVLDVILNLNKNLAVSQRELFGWGVGSLLLLFVLLSLGRPRRQDVLWWGFLGLFVVGYSGYWFSGGPDLGARYWYPALVALVVLAVRAMSEIAQRSPLAGTGRALGFAAAVCSFWAAVVFVPSRIDRKYLRYRDVSDDVRALSDSLGLTSDLVFIKSPYRAHYQSAFNLNSVPVNAMRPLFASDAGPRSRERVVAAFPTRRVWTFAPDSASGNLVVMTGPLLPGAVP